MGKMLEFHWSEGSGISVCRALTHCCMCQTVLCDWQISKKGMVLHRWSYKMMVQQVNAATNWWVNRLKVQQVNGATSLWPNKLIVLQVEVATN